jgi:hypothetical protein
VVAVCGVFRVVSNEYLYRHLKPEEVWPWATQGGRPAVDVSYWQHLYKIPKIGVRG